MMRRIGLLALLFPALLAAQGPQQVQPRIFVTRTADLKFGTVLLRKGPASMVMAPDGTRIPSGDLSLGPGVTSPAAFELQGPPNLKFTVHVSPEAVQLRQGVKHLLPVQTFTYSLPEERWEFDANGRARIQVGATLNLPALPRVGIYAEPQVTLRIHTPGLPPAFTTFAINVQIQANLKLSQIAPMSLGDIVAGGSGGRILLKPSGTRQILEGSGLRLMGGTSASPGVFQLDGALPGGISVTLPPFVLLNGAGTPLRLEDLTWNWTGGDEDRRACDHDDDDAEGGPRRLSVGGTLVINPNQAPGPYSGTYLVSLHYN